MASDGQAAGLGDVRRAHGYHPLTVKRVVEETADTRSLVLEIPPDLEEAFRYRPGQFCTFRLVIGGEEHHRSYSMSTAPESDPEMAVTVKRMPGGVVSNWLLDHVRAGDRLDTTRPAGVFCLTERKDPVIAFCGGSGITPVISIAKSALHSTGRPVRLVYANRDPGSVIFERLLATLEGSFPGRIEIHHHLDSEKGYMTAEDVRRHAPAEPADYYICGPGAFMDVVETGLKQAGVDASRIFIERFLTPDRGAPPVPVGGPDPVGAGGAVPAVATQAVTETVTVIMKGKKTTVAHQAGDTLLETARRAALRPPFSCESGSCATCMALLREGTASMRVNDALTPEEVDEGWVLTCQAVPTSPTVVVEYESL